ncbi:hypothetical protein [Sediminibacterium sp.]|uniref:hypothetical protein n=1 Tax=Sediminibacterium sp. TaxID=1917865 RepID=UPI0027328C92|nr:hypothetical protein [Sediminibacterium sp.]MDP3393042.1 hypothetical protein [Sediminibacterium sp.]MDP3567250.1 hypothetical protein [Sediminibacterium sp.]
MKKLSLIFGLMFFASFSFGQIFSRLPNESADSFIKRVFKVDELAHPVIETKEWDSTKRVIFAFVAENSQSNGQYDQNKESIILGYCFFKINPNNYHRALIDTFHEDGGEPRIETLFFENTDKDKEREIAIFVRIPQMHRGADIYGDFYNTYFYDNPNLVIPPNRLTKFEKLSAKFSGYEGYSGNKQFKFKYKDVASIRKALKEMGY